jgi:hypothetical protein
MDLSIPPSPRKDAREQNGASGFFLVKSPCILVRVRYRTAEAEDVAVVVCDLEGSEAVVGVGEGPGDWSVFGEEFSVEGVGVGGEDVGVPTCPWGAGGVGLGVDVGGNGLEHEHHLIARHDGPEVFGRLVATSFVEDGKAEFGLVEVQGGGQVVDDEEGSDAL